MACIYVLYAESSPAVVRYIGRTRADTPDKRFKMHIKNASDDARKTHVYNWIRSVLSSGGTVCVRSIELIENYEESADREKHWIAFYREQGHDLTNLTDGGEGTVGLRREYLPHSVEARENNRKAQLGKILTEEHKKNIGKGNLGRVVSEETRKKIRNSNIGKKRSEETKKKISESKKGKPWTNEARSAHGKRSK